MTKPGIEPATFRFVAQYLNHCATAVPSLKLIPSQMLNGSHRPDLSPLYFHLIGPVNKSFPGNYDDTNETVQRRGKPC